jgi:hypothetical protein
MGNIRAKKDLKNVLIKDGELVEHQEVRGTNLERGLITCLPTNQEPACDLGAV